MSEDPLVEEWTKNIGSGEAYPVEIVRVARAVKRKCPGDPGVETFASLGNAACKNVERDMHHRLWGLHGLDLKPFFIDVSTKCPDTFGVKPMSLATLAPYEVFAALHRAVPQFGTSVLGSGAVAGVSNYWKSLGEGYQHHVASDPAWATLQASTILLLFHSDGGSIFKNTDISIWSWGSALVGDINTFDGKFLVCVIDEDIKIKHVTDAEIVGYLVWNVAVLESGVHPSVDHRGSPLTGKRLALVGSPLASGWRASCIGTLGDLKEKTKVHRYFRNWQCNFLCEKCLGNRHLQKGSAYDFSAGALWRRLMVTHESYLATSPPLLRSPWTLMRCLCSKM